MKLTRFELILAAVGLFLGALTVALLRPRPAPQPAPVREEIGAPLVPKGTTPAAARPFMGQQPTLPASGRSAKAEPEPGLPPLVPGSPLNDERYAQISARVIVAGMRNQGRKDWQVDTMVYLARVLDQEQVSEKDYTAYGIALNQQPDRARAVGEKIKDKAEKLLGHPITREALPTIKVDRQGVQDLGRKTEEKLNGKTAP